MQCRNRTADQRLCFRYTDSTNPLTSLVQNFKPVAIYCRYTAQFVSDLFGDSEDKFSHNAAHFMFGFMYIQIISTLASVPATKQPTFCLINLFKDFFL